MPERVPGRHRTDPAPPPEAQALGQRIRRLRAARGWTQRQLAARADLARAYVAGVEVGLRNPSLRNLGKIASALGVSVAGLFESV